MTATLRFGLSGVVPPEAKAAWGARFIVAQGGHVDLPWDRQDCIGSDEDRALLLAALASTYPLDMLTERISTMLRSDRMQTRRAEQFDLLTTDDLKVVANTNASAGYCYVAAWLRPDKENGHG